MIRLSTQRLRDGMIMAQSIYNRKGASFLTRGTVLNQQYIQQLKQIGVTHVNVTSMDADIQLMPKADIVQDETRQAAVSRLFDFYEKVQDNGSMSDVGPLQDVSEKIIMDLVMQPDGLVQMTDLRLFDDYTFSHSVNVAALSAMMGVALKFSQPELMDLTLGALLHDIGKLDVPIEILNKPSSLSDDEFAMIKNHPVSGYGRMMGMDMKKLNVRTLASIARQHHEHMDGHGYPDHAKGGQIHKYAQIVAVADVYDALTSSRAYKKAYPPHVAYKIMTKCSGKQFNEDLLNTFFDHVAIYPVGCILKTNWGLGIVKKVRVGLTRFPILTIFTNTHNDLLETPLDVDIADYGLEAIHSVMDDMEVFSTIRKLGVDPSQYLLNDEES